MAIEYKVTRYKCKFKCGKWHNKKEFIENHEKTCWKDIKHKTCITCKYGAAETEWEEGPVEAMDRQVRFRFCLHPSESDYYNGVLDELSSKNNNQHWPMINCRCWNNK